MKLKKLIPLLGLTLALTAMIACAKSDAVADTMKEEITDQKQAEGDASTEEASGETPDGEKGEGMAQDIPARIYGTITDISGNEITVDNQSDISSQGEMILTIDPQNTILADAGSGIPLNLSDVEPGSFVAYLGPAMTMSLPPQCTPYVVIANIPEDGETPYYAVIAEEPVVGDNSYRTVKATDGETYVIPDNAHVKPFRTRNILSVEDIHAGTRCLLWLDEQDEAFRVVVLDAE